MATLAYAQRAWLIAELASRGITANQVVIADDENLDLAQQHGFDVIERDNRYLGAKFNDGVEHACRNGADYVMPAGSDDWIHPDVFEDLDGVSVMAGRRLLLIDLPTGRGASCVGRGFTGMIPWLVPARYFEACGYRPARESANRGIDGTIARHIRAGLPWRFEDPNPAARVDFKSDTNLNPYDLTSGALRQGDEIDPWPLLAEHYPADLVTQARVTHEAMAVFA